MVRRSPEHLPRRAACSPLCELPGVAECYSQLYYLCGLLEDFHLLLKGVAKNVKESTWVDPPINISK